MKLVTSEYNPNFKIARKLASSNRFCKVTGDTLAEGVHLAQELVKLNRRKAKIIVDQVFLDIETYEHNKEIKELVEKFQAERVDIITLPPILFKQVSPVETSVGIVCQIESPQKPDHFKKGDYIYLDTVQDPGNVGTILRTALAAGVNNIAQSKGTAWPWSPKALRAGMGAQFHATIWADVDIEELKSQTGNECLVADAKKGKDLFTEEWGIGKPTIWVFGSEGKGVHQNIHEAADKSLLIPLSSRTESLNVAAAAAVCLFEQKRRRQAGA
ncbi:MAG: RNA methyltransferase [Burkholderiales bacterium]|nr:RNA methyltransferase [Burkholderiales bacterium]